MFASETRSKDSSANGRSAASPTWKRTRSSSSGGVNRRASAIIASARSTPTTFAAGNRRAIANAALPVPVPRSSASAGDSGSAARPAWSTVNASSVRLASHTGAIALNWRRVNERKGHDIVLGNRLAPDDAADVIDETLRRTGTLLMHGAVDVPTVQLGLVANDQIPP